MQVFFYLLVGLVGLCLGSFLSVFTYRRPKGMGVVLGRSKCPNCKAEISWLDNIPILSFIFLKGRCRVCGKKISLRYLLIEFSTMSVLLVYFHYFFACGIDFMGSTLCSLRGVSEIGAFVLIAFLTLILLAITIVDLEKKIIPDELTFLGLFLVTTFYLFTNYNALIPNLFVGFSVSVFFLLIHLITLGRGMGLGDVKFVILGGFLLGWAQSAVWLFLAFTSGAVIGVFLILLKKAKFGREIAFGPFLAGSLLFTIIFGQKVLNLWFQLN